MWKWINLIMQYINTVSYSILINEEPRKHLNSKRGIYQGDPLSPYLFLLCAEVLLAKFHEVRKTGLLQEWLLVEEAQE